ncbi:MAG: bifunctional adenosylcobinamide kinase/adenosylcobinamide-phosphate guanylyltransferase [Clostridia bacterium]|nr:bifunctional adenosylcobinamide kinase/adenosylcobinamide-phosphate guanylyltransferase [Clostridia bacterium]
MTVLVLGPNGSGKSAFAEKTAVRLSSGAPTYIATMIPYGEEGKARVEKHRKQREFMGFCTVEKSFGVSDIPIPADTVVLLEDVSNLLGNALFADKGLGNEDSVFTDITALCGKCRAAVLVSIDGLTPAQAYDDQTRGYVDALNRLNRRLSRFADAVIMMRDGRPVFAKGDAHALG